VPNTTIATGQPVNAATRPKQQQDRRDGAGEGDEQLQADGVADGHGSARA